MNNSTIFLFYFLYLQDKETIVIQINTAITQQCANLFVLNFAVVNIVLRAVVFESRSFDCEIWIGNDFEIVWRLKKIEKSTYIWEM